jgi:membrane-associated phospholipid phosphatase
MPWPDFFQINSAVLSALNGVVGRSWVADGLLALSLDNLLVKAGPTCACFAYGWFLSGAAVEVDRRRRILLVTLFSLLVIAPTSKLASEAMLSPRPFVLSAQAYALDEDVLVQLPQARVEAPQTGEMATRADALKRGVVTPNDLSTFPSDHAAFFMALSLGIFLAARLAGTLALCWTVAVTLASRVVAGMHSPVDIIAGAALGATILVLLQLLAGRWGAGIVDKVSGWTRRNEALASALLLLVLIEVANTMGTLDRLRDLAGAAAGQLV